MIVTGGVVTCKCGNAARYMNERGELCCATCPLKEGVDSIKLDDVPRLLAWARNLIAFCQEGGIEKPRLTYRLLGDLIDVVQRSPRANKITVDNVRLLERLDEEIVDADAEASRLRATREEVTRVASPAPSRSADDVQKCCCYRPGWLGPHHSDPNCEYRDDPQ